MATRETANLGPLKEPNEEQKKAFKEIETELKDRLLNRREHYSKHHLPYFDSIENLTNKQLTNFSVENLIKAREGKVAYGRPFLGKVLIPETGDGYIHFRALIREIDGGVVCKFHDIHSEMPTETNGNKYRAIFSVNDELEWFDT